ncbi:MAG: WD40 repeat domain-containing protein, partial [Chloroflexota bacterium]
EILAAQVDTENVCTITPVTQIPAYTAPNATLEGVFTANTQPYRVYGLDADGAWYQIASEAGLGWVEATSVTIAGNCDIVPVTSVTNPDIETACFITPQGGFTNVRSIPSTDGQQVARIYENQVYQATARNTAATWYYIEPAGWVSNTVTFTEGDCTNITVNDNAIGIGFSEEIAIPLDADTATIIERFTCPEDFVGYLAPRISTGTSTAQVEAGNLPNTLRAFPSVDDTEAPRLGVIQPARVLDRVIAGPACNQGFVWWYVEIDGVAGWTAESNFESDDYFLEPTGETGTTTDTDTTTDTSDASSASTATIAVGETAIDDMVYNASGERLFVQTSELGFGDGRVGAVIVYATASNQSEARIEEPSGIFDIAYATGSDDIAVAAGNGTITLYNTTTLEQSAQLTEVYSDSPTVRIELTPDSSLLIVGTCTNGDCTAGQVAVYDLAGGGELATTLELSGSAALDMVVSADGSTLGILTSDSITFYSLIDPDDISVISTWQNSDGFGVSDVAISADGASAFFSGCNNADCTQGRIGLLNTADGTLLGIVPSHPTLATHLTLNPDGTRFVTVADTTGEIIERSASTGEEIQSFTVDSPVTMVVYTPDGNTLVAGTNDGQIVFLSLTQ